MTGGHPRLLAVDPSPRGFGFAIFEGPGRLVDWGLAQVRGPKNRESLRRFAELLDRYSPAILVVEDCADPASRRRSRARQLIAAMATHPAVTDRRVILISARRTKEILAGHPRATKEQVAAIMARRCPELAGKVPPHRRAWMSEDPRMSIFDAAALGLAAQEASTRPRAA